MLSKCEYTVMITIPKTCPYTFAALAVVLTNAFNFCIILNLKDCH